MAEENQHAGLLQMREQLKQLYRARLPPDMGWCDDNTRRNQQVRVSDVSVSLMLGLAAQLPSIQTLHNSRSARSYQVEAAYQHVRGDWEAAAACREPVLESALAASTTDNEHQTIDMTLSNDRAFWSSAGSLTQIAYEALTFELSGPACRVVALQLAPYRALYQEGYPVYPPMRLQVWVGPTPHTLQPASPWHDVQASDALQTFALWDSAPIGSFLQVRMYGKQQRQREDNQFYIAVRYVAAAGDSLSVTRVLALQPLLRSGTLQLAGATPSVPGMCCRALEAAATFGLGPEQQSVSGAGAAAGGGAVRDAATVPAPAGSHATQGQQQSGQLVVRSAALQLPQEQQPDDNVDGQQQQQQMMSEGAGASSSRQQQHQQGSSAVQRVTAGIRSILGRRGATAAALVAGEAGSSKRPQHPPQAETSTSPRQSPEQQQQQQRQPPGTPLWLLEDAGAAGGAGAAAAALRQRQQQQRQRQGPSPSSLQQTPVGDSSMQETPESPGGNGHRYAAVNEDSEEGRDWADEYRDSEEYEQWLEAADRAAQEEEEREQDPEQLDVMWQAANRLHDEINARLRHVAPMQHEQVLAALLADAPMPGGLQGGVGGGGAVAGAAAAQQRQQGQQEGEAEGVLAASAARLRTPPVVPVGGQGSSSTCSSVWCEVSTGSAGDDGWGTVKARAVLDQAVHGSWLPKPLPATSNTGEQPAASTAAAGSGRQCVAATQLFQWQPQVASGGSSSSSRLTTATPQAQWLQPAGLFCEGTEADAQAVW